MCTEIPAGQVRFAAEHCAAAVGAVSSAGRLAAADVYAGAGAICTRVAAPLERGCRLLQDGASRFCRGSLALAGESRLIGIFW